MKEQTFKVTIAENKKFHDIHTDEIQGMIAVCLRGANVDVVEQKSKIMDWNQLVEYVATTGLLILAGVAATVGIITYMMSTL